MAKQTLNEWKKEIAAKYGTHGSCIHPDNSFAARGSSNTRQILGRIKSPFGGWYVVFSAKTNSQK